MNVLENEKLNKNSFDVRELQKLTEAILEDEIESFKEKDYALQVLSKMQEDFRKLPVIYERYCRDISFACTSGLPIEQTQLAGVLEDGIYSYSQFRTYFDMLKELVRKYENEQAFILDLVSAKDRIESVCVILLEAEANLKKLFAV